MKTPQNGKPRTATATTTTTPATATDGEDKRRVILIDDHPIVRDGLARLIDTQPDLVVSGQAKGPPDALHLINKQLPDLVILDLTLTGGDGLELCKQLHDLHPDLPVLVLSMHDESFYAERSLRAGAMGYVMKQEPPETVMLAIRRVLHGQTYLSEPMSAKLLHSIRGHRQQVEDSPIERLSDRELEVFRMIGQGQPVRAIAEAMFLSPKTIETHKEHIKQKLGLKSGNELLQYAIESRTHVE
jgi:DNA-binding NarL/FixJ family response regulator